MVHYIEIRSLLNRKPLPVLNEEFEQMGDITYNKQNSEFNITCVNHVTSEKCYIKTNPIKLKPKHILFNEGKEEIGRVSIGVKIIHSIVESDKYHFVKSAFWKIKYQAYDNRTVVADLEVIRKNNKRYFKITSKHDDYVLSISLFLLAQAVRHKAIMN